MVDRKLAHDLRLADGVSTQIYAKPREIAHDIRTPFPSTHIVSIPKSGTKITSPIHR